MNNPHTFHQELHSMSLSDLDAFDQFVRREYEKVKSKGLHHEDTVSVIGMYDAVRKEIQSRIDLLKNKFEEK